MAAFAGCHAAGSVEPVRDGTCLPEQRRRVVGCASAMQRTCRRLDSSIRVLAHRQLLRRRAHAAAKVFDRCLIRLTQFAGCFAPLRLRSQKEHGPAEREARCGRRPDRRRCRGEWRCPGAVLAAGSAMREPARWANSIADRDRGRPDVAGRQAADSATRRCRPGQAAPWVATAGRGRATARHATVAIFRTFSKRPRSTRGKRGALERSGGERRRGGRRRRQASVGPGAGAAGRRGVFAPRPCRSFSRTPRRSSWRSTEAPRISCRIAPCLSRNRDNRR